VTCKIPSKSFHFNETKLYTQSKTFALCTIPVILSQCSGVNGRLAKFLVCQTVTVA